MLSRYIAGLCAAFITAGLTGPRADQPLNVRLGYPADSKPLIINADDLAMSHSENDASLTAIYARRQPQALVRPPAHRPFPQVRSTYRQFTRFDDICVGGIQLSPTRLSPCVRAPLSLA